MIQAILKKWWVESDFKAPNLPLSLRLKVSGCVYNSIYNNTWTKQVKQLSKQHHTQWSKCQRYFYVTHWQIKYFWHFCWQLIFIHFHYMKIHRLFFFQFFLFVWSKSINYITCCTDNVNLNQSYLNASIIVIYLWHYIR